MNHNQHGVYAADGKIEAGKKLPLVDIGASHYSNLVLFNHSCAPNTVRINKGHRVNRICNEFYHVENKFLDLSGGKKLHQKRRGGL